MNRDIEISHAACDHDRSEISYNPITPQAIKATFATRHYSVIEVLQHFADAHLPEELHKVTVPMRVLAFDIVDNTKDGPTLTVALRILLNARETLIQHELSLSNWSGYYGEQGILRK